MYDDMSDDTPVSKQNYRMNPVLPTLEADIDSDDMIPESLTQNRWPEYDDEFEYQSDNKDPGNYTDTQDSDVDEDPENAVKHLQRMVRLTYFSSMQISV
jgi:hypothetical protein